MEKIACMKDVVASTHQYRGSPTDQNLNLLQKHLDVLISVTEQSSSLEFFNPKQLFPTKCLACLHDILNDSHMSLLLTHKALILLIILTKRCDVQEMLHESFQMSACLTNCLCHQPKTVATPVSLLCLQLLQTIMYNRKVNCDQRYATDLFSFLVQHIVDKESELTPACLGLLAILCRNNPSVHAHIKSNKPFFKSLIGYLSHQNCNIIILAVCILSGLCLHEEFGAKLFKASNMNQTLQLMFNGLVQSNTNLIQRCTADLFIDLVGQVNIQQSLARYDYLQPCLKQIIALLGGSDMQAVAKLFEVLLAFSSVPAIRSKLCETFLETGVPPGGDGSSSFAMVVSMVRREADDSTSLLALQFLTEVYQEVLNDGKQASPPTCTPLLLPMLIEVLHAPTKDTQSSRLRFEQIDKALCLLLTLCVDNGLKEMFSRAVSTATCVSLLDFQLVNSRVASATETQPDCNDAGADIVLHVLELMLMLIECVPDMQAAFSQAMQSSLLVPFLVRGVTSGSKHRVRSALKLISMGEATLENFPSVILGDSLAVFNSTRVSPTVTDSPSDCDWQQAIPVIRCTKMSEPGVKSESNRTASSAEIDASVESLIERMNSNLELKSPRMSDIIGVFQHQLHSLQSKENHLEDLLKAKELALEQADRVIAQYRCRRVQADAEDSQLKILLQQSERNGEELTEELKELDASRNRVKTDVKRLEGANARLEAIAAEHRDLLQAHAEQTQKLESTECSLEALRKEHQRQMGALEVVCTERQGSIQEREAMIAQTRSELAALIQNLGQPMR